MTHLRAGVLELAAAGDKNELFEDYQASQRVEIGPGDSEDLNLEQQKELEASEEAGEVCL